MEMTETNQPINKWQRSYLLTGTVCGAVIGLATAYFLVRGAERRGEGPPDISTTDLLRSTIGVIGIMRGIAALGERQ